MYSMKPIPNSTDICHRGNIVLNGLHASSQLCIPAFDRFPESGGKTPLNGILTMDIITRPISCLMIYEKIRTSGKIFVILGLKSISHT